MKEVVYEPSGFLNDLILLEKTEAVVPDVQDD